MELNDSLSSGATIDRASLESLIVSTYDEVNGLPIDFPGTLEADSGLTLNVPYTVKGSITSIPAYSTSVPIYNEKTQDGETGIVATFSWTEQLYLAEGNGVFRAKITITDGSIKDGAYNAKKLDTQNDAAGIVVATFRYPKDNLGSTGEVTLKVIPVIPDRMFGKADNNGDTNTHSFLYLPVTHPITGQTWLNNNLGAEYADTTNPKGNFNFTQQATASNDHLAYGSLFQWGRKPDGHELMNWKNGNTGTAKHGITTTKSNEPTDVLFITDGSALYDRRRYPKYDWRINPDDTLWANESSVNNVCPVGYRLPTAGDDEQKMEWEEEVKSWNTKNAKGGLESTLKLSMPGYRFRKNGDMYYVGTSGYYWSASVNDANGRYLDFHSTLVRSDYSNVRASGFSVRCKK
jgi:hypothetical protein